MAIPVSEISSTHEFVVTSYGSISIEKKQFFLERIFQWLGRFITGTTAYDITSSGIQNLSQKILKQQQDRQHIALSSLKKEITLYKEQDKALCTPLQVLKNTIKTSSSVDVVTKIRTLLRNFEDLDEDRIELTLELLRSESGQEELQNIYNNIDGKSLELVSRLLAYMLCASSYTQVEALQDKIYRLLSCETRETASSCIQNILYLIHDREVIGVQRVEHILNGISNKKNPDEALLSLYIALAHAFSDFESALQKEDLEAINRAKLGLDATLGLLNSQLGEYSLKKLTRIEMLSQEEQIYIINTELFFKLLKGLCVAALSKDIDKAIKLLTDDVSKTVLFWIEKAKDPEEIQEVQRDISSILPFFYSQVGYQALKNIWHHDSESLIHLMSFMTIAHSIVRVSNYKATQVNFTQEMSDMKAIFKKILATQGTIGPTKNPIFDQALEQTKVELPDWDSFIGSQVSYTIDIQEVASSFTTQQELLTQFSVDLTRDISRDPFFINDERIDPQEIQGLDPQEIVTWFQNASGIEEVESDFAQKIFACMTQVPKILSLHVPQFLFTNIDPFLPDIPDVYFSKTGKRTSSISLKDNGNRAIINHTIDQRVYDLGRKEYKDLIAPVHIHVELNKLDPLQNKVTVTCNFKKTS